MKTKIIVYHMNRDLAAAQGLAEKYDGHSYPTGEVSCVGYSSKLGQRGIAAVKQLWDAHCYEPVAIYDSSKEGSDALEDAFHLTNHIDKAWNRTGHEENLANRLQPLHTDNTRSTSVGDVMCAITGTSQGLYAVASCGFQVIK